MEMELKGQNILIISPESWSHIFVSKHHYAIQLAAKGNTVYFLNPPSNKLFEVAPTNYKDVFTIDYNGFIRGLRYLPAVLIRHFIRSKFNKIQKRTNKKFDIIWSFDNSVFFDFRALPDGILKISHIVDLNQDFETAKAAKTANICFGTTRFIINRLKKYNQNSHFVNHGFSNVTKLMDKVKLPGTNKIKSVLVGNLSMPYLDWEVLLLCVQNHQEIDFVFYGPNADEYSEKAGIQNVIKTRIKKYSNTFFPGKISSTSIPAVLNAADVLLVSYQEKHQKDQANPHKIMEYLALGKIIAATKTIEYGHLVDDNLIAMSDKNTDYANMFSEIVSNLGKWNNKELQQKRIIYALDNTYDKQIERIETLIQKNV